jgi:hypothetical protein
MAEVALSGVMISDGACDEVFIEEQNLVSQLLMEVHVVTGGEHTADMSGFT